MSKVIVCLLLIVAGILPTTRTRRPRHRRMVRGVKNINKAPQLRKKEVQAATKEFRRFRKIAILPPASAKKLQSHSIGIMAEMSRDLLYVPQCIAIDPASVLTQTALTNARQVPPATTLLKIGKTLGADVLIVGLLSANGDKCTLTGTAYGVRKAQLDELAKIRRQGQLANVVQLADAVLIDLLRQQRLEIPLDRLRQMKLVMTKSATARQATDQGFFDLYRSTAPSLTVGKSRSLNQSALKHAKTAIAADPNYIRAYILQASALVNLSSERNRRSRQRVRNCLRDGNNRLGNSPVDELTRLEFAGDYARFYEGEEGFLKAVQNYQAMLKINPTHMRALWSLAECYLSEHGSGKAPPADQAKARRFAARILATQKASAMAAFLRDPK